MVHSEMEFDDYLGMVVAGDVDEERRNERVHEMDTLYIEPHIRTLKIPPDT